MLTEPVLCKGWWILDLPASATFDRGRQGHIRRCRLGVVGDRFVVRLCLRLLVVEGDHVVVVGFRLRHFAWTQAHVLKMEVVVEASNGSDEQRVY